MDSIRSKINFDDEMSLQSRQRAVWGLAPLGSVGAANPTDPMEQNPNFIETDENRRKRIEFQERASSFRSTVYAVKPYPWSTQMVRVLQCCDTFR